MLFNPLEFEGIKVIIDCRQKFFLYCGKFYKFATGILNK